MVTHSSTSRPVQCLCMAERTGCPVLTDLWSYVFGSTTDAILKIFCITTRVTSMAGSGHQQAVVFEGDQALAVLGDFLIVRDDFGLEILCSNGIAGSSLRVIAVAVQVFPDEQCVR